MPDKRLDAVEPGAVTTLRNLVDKLDKIESDYSESVRRQTRFNRWVFAVGVIVAILLGGLAYTAIGVRGLVAYVADCNNPAGDCAKRNQERTNDVLVTLGNNILMSAIWTNQCARLYPNESGPEYNKKLKACVFAQASAARK